MAFALVSNALIIGLMAALWKAFKGIKSNRELPEIIFAAILAMCVVPFGFAGLVQWLLDIEYGRPFTDYFMPSISWISFSAPAAIATSAATALGLLLFLILKGFRSDYAHGVRQQERFEALTSIVLYVAIAIALFGGYIGIFMTQAYPRIPSQLGGGQPYEVRLLVVKEEISAARELGLIFPPKGQLSNTTLLLYESDQQYILRLPDNRIAVINKSLVSGLIS